MDIINMVELLMVKEDLPLLLKILFLKITQQMIKMEER